MTSLKPPPFIEVSVTFQESKWTMNLYARCFFYWILELFRRCVVFVFVGFVFLILFYPR